MLKPLLLVDVSNAFNSLLNWGVAIRNRDVLFALDMVGNHLA